MINFNVTNEITVNKNDGSLLVFIAKGGQLGKLAQAVESKSPGIITHRIQKGDLLEKAGQSITLFEPHNCSIQRLVVMYVDNLVMSALDYRELLTSTVQASKGLNQTTIQIALTDISVTDHSVSWMAQQLTEAFALSHYQFDDFKQKALPESALKQVDYIISSWQALTEVETAVATGKAIGVGKNYAKRLGDLPPNVCHPSYLANEAMRLASENEKLTVKVLNEDEMAELGMHSLLSVGHGSAQPSKLIVMEYKGASANEKPYALVGKGVTFDSGGISIKPGAQMDEMKYDMCGAASVFGAVASVLALDLAVNVVAIVGAAENMPSDRATRPGDVIQSMSGKTIEVLNTDAEGRLVLCDALTYVQQYQPQTIIDTGACIVALGDHAAGLLSNDDTFAKQLIKSGETSGDQVWQLPIWPAYSKQLKSNFADLANIGSPGAGTITAACFLAEFVKDQTWAHIDIAGVAWNKGENKGATGKPVGLLVDYLSKVEVNNS